MFRFPRSLKSALKKQLLLVGGADSPRDALLIFSECLRKELAADFCVVRLNVPANRRSDVFACVPEKGRFGEVLACFEGEDGELLAETAKEDEPFARDVPDSAKKPFANTLIVPLSADLIVSLEREKSFTGYLAFVYSKAAKRTAKEDTSLPLLCSEFAASVLRRELPRSEALGAYAHNMKHYLMIHEELIRLLEPAENEAAGKMLSKLEKALKHMLIETNSVLLADKDDAGHLTVSPMRLCINELVEEALADLKPLFASGGIKVELDLQRPLPDVNVDPAIFPSALNNLLDNALKYSDVDGEVLIRTFKEERTVGIEISNTGPGISAADRERIFTRHYRGQNAQKKPGNGLGLYLVKRIVEDHGGQIFLDAAVQERTKFIILLPIAAEPESPVSDTSA